LISIRKATPDDEKDFVDLILISAPYFPFLFGDSVIEMLKDLFQHSSNLFSYEHVTFLHIHGKTVGMLLGYDWRVKKMESLRTGFLMFKNIGVTLLIKIQTFMRFNMRIGGVSRDEYYISNIAVYPEYRGKGYGKKLMLEAERQAKGMGARKIVLDVEKDNIRAIHFYKKLNYKIQMDFSIPLHRNDVLRFLRMIKEVNTS